MSEFDKLLNGISSTDENCKGNNAKYVKLTYTRSGTVVLSATNNTEENVTSGELKKFIKS